MLLKQAIMSFLNHMDFIDRSQETIRGYALELKTFCNFVTVKYNCPVYMEDIVLQDLEDYMRYEKERGIASSSRSRALYIIKSFYSYCCKQDLCPKNLADLLEPVKVKQKERAFITEAEFNDLVNAIEHPVIRTVVQTMFYTGGRMSEMVHLKLKHVDFQTRILHIIDGKGRKDRRIPICDKLYDILTHYLSDLRESDSPLFFATVSTGKVSSTYINRCLHEAVGKLGWEKDISAHVLRHSFGTNLLEKGASVVSIQKLLGHSNLAVTSRYLHQDMNTLNAVVNLL